MPLTFRFPPGQSALSRLFSALALIAIFVMALFLGTVLFLAMLGVLGILATALYLRFWWLRRQMLQQSQPSPKGRVTLEGEYSVAKSGKKPRPDGRA